MILMILLLCSVCSTAELGPLKSKANQYDNWNAKHHQPYYGGQLGVLFADIDYKKVVRYIDLGDSCIWTGVYLGAQALRYSLTKDSEAKQTVTKAIKALDGYLHVTYTPGYIARYWGPQQSLPYENDAKCFTNPRCHKVIKGKYAGDFWEGGTTKDQYSGWFFGMSLAYSSIDDPDLRNLIREDVTEVVDKLIKDNWIIVDEKGKYEKLSAGQRPTHVYQLSWLLIAYDMTNNEKYKKELDKRLGSLNLLSIKLASYSGIFNKYTQYYANNLGHITWYNLLRLARKYLPTGDYKELKRIFTNNIHDRVKLSHNPWFNAIFMSQGDYDPNNKLYKNQLLEDLFAFRPPPNCMYYRPKKDPSTYTLDPVTGWLKYYPSLTKLMKTIKLGLKPQAKDAFPIKDQCSNDFIFQRSPFEIEECGHDIPTLIQPGIDYLAAYWLSVHHNFINFDQ